MPSSARQPQSQVPPRTPPTPLKVLGDRRQWQLDRDWAFLNHGSFGARPKAVVRMQRKWVDQFEAHPIRFLDDQPTRDRIMCALASVADFLDVNPAGLVFVPNVTDAVATVLRTVELGPRDNVLSTSHAYGAVLRAIEARCREVGATPNVVSLPCPLPEAAAIEAALLKAATKRTKLVVLDQITSPSAALLPVQRLIRAFAKRGIPVFVDGAHAAGMLESPCPKGAAWWTTNLHKWGLAPVSSAVLWTSTSRRASTRPLAPSHAHFDGYQAAFAWQGTRDISPWLTAPDAISWVHDNGGWPALRRHNALLGAWAGEQLTQAWGTPMSASPDMREGLSMVAVQLPPRAKQWSVPERLRDALANQFQVEAPIWKDGPRWWVRVSCQAYTRPADIRGLINGLESLLS